MERRIRTLVERRGARALAEYLALPGQDAAELDAFLDRVTINVSHLWRHPRPVDGLGRHVLPELADDGPHPRLERRLLLRRRGLHDRGRLPARPSRAPASRSAAPTSTSAWSRAPARAGSPPRTRAPAPPSALRALLRAATATAGEARAGAARMVRFDDRRPAAHAGPAGLVRPGPLPQHRHLLHRGGARRAARAARRRPRPGGYLVVGSSERVATRAALGLRPPSPSSTARPD